MASEIRAAKGDERASRAVGLPGRQGELCSTPPDRSPTGSACRAASHARRVPRRRPRRRPPAICATPFDDQQLFQRRQPVVVIVAAVGGRIRLLTSEDSASAHSLQENRPFSCSATVSAKASACQGSAKTRRVHARRQVMPAQGSSPRRRSRPTASGRRRRPRSRARRRRRCRPIAGSRPCPCALVSGKT